MLWQQQMLWHLCLSNAWENPKSYCGTETASMMAFQDGTCRFSAGAMAEETRLFWNARRTHFTCQLWPDQVQNLQLGKATENSKSSKTSDCQESRSVEERRSTARTGCVQQPIPNLSTGQTCKRKGWNWSVSTIQGQNNILWCCLWIHTCWAPSYADKLRNDCCQD